jgi:hypothetical protein
MDSRMAGLEREHVVSSTCLGRLGKGYAEVDGILLSSLGNEQSPSRRSSCHFLRGRRGSGLDWTVIPCFSGTLVQWSFPPLKDGDGMTS